MTRVGALLAALLIAISGCQRQPATPWEWQLPPGIPAPQVPADNPLTPAKVALGRQLFYDTRLSGNSRQSCASCHRPERSFSDGLATAVGSTGASHRRNSLALVNVAYNATLTWAHPGLTQIERQILIPMFSEQPVELGIAGHEDEVLARLQARPEYRQLFASAWPGQRKPITFDHVVKSLASFVRSLTSFGSRFDQYAYYGEDAALNESELRGLNLFLSERLECHHCHGGFNFTQSTTHTGSLFLEMPFHNTGLHNIDGRGASPAGDTGLMEHSRQLQDMGRFRAPTLRNIELTAPYMHDGSLPTLAAVLDFYAAGGRVSRDGGDGRVSPLKNSFVRGFQLTPQERSDVLAFLHSLTDREFVTNANLGPPQGDLPQSGQ